MSLETRVFALIASVRKEVRSLQSQIDAGGGSGGSGTTYPASETVSGVLKIATQSDVNNGAVDDEAVTPLKLQSRLSALLASYQPLSTNLTALASVVSGAMGRTLLTAPDASSAKASLSLSKTDVGLSNVDNTSDVNKPVSMAQQTALNLKADTTALPTKSSIGLSNVDNTSDVNKPVSSAQQTALNQKANLVSPTFSGTPTAPTAAVGTSTTQLATTAFTASAISSLGLSAIATSGSASDITTGMLPTSVLPPLAINDMFTVGSQAAMLGLTAQRGDVAIRTDTNVSYMLSTDSPGTLADWKLLTGAGNVTSVAGRAGVVVLTKSDVGLSNVDNTADIDKPISTSQQAALNYLDDQLTGMGGMPVVTVDGGSTPAESQNGFTAVSNGELAPHTHIPSEVGLGSVDNTSDLNKPISTAQQTALNLKADVTALPTKSSLGLGNVDNTSDVNKPVSTAQQTALNLKADTTALPTKTSLGLSNVDNTSDANKPVSAAQQTALNLKADTTALPTKTSLGLGNVDNTSDVNKPVSTAQQSALNLKADTTALPTKSSLGLGNVDNTSDVNKPVSTAQQNALNLKADTTALPTKTSLGLANVDNTSDANKPVSTAQQTALNLKSNLDSPTLTGTPTAPTPATSSNSTQLATTAFVVSVVAANTAGTPTLLDGGTP